jgi:SAM-dependent methyltransferase
MIPSDRVRPRQGAAIIRDGVPYSDPSTTLSLLHGAAVGHFLARHCEVFHGRLLDLGCGNQPYREWYGNHTERSIAIDAFVSNALDVTGLADRLPFKDASFDVVLATEVLEHVADADAAVGEIRRVLAPGGHAVVTVPFLYPTHEAPYDFRRFTHFGLVELLERQGLEVTALDAKGGPGLLVGHCVVLGATAAVRRLEAREGSAPWGERSRQVVAGVQQALLRRLRFAPGVQGTASAVSLGYMAVARRPASS